MSLRGRRFTRRECKGSVKSMVSVVKGFEVRRGQSSPIETEAEEGKGAWIRKMKTNTKARVSLQLLCDTYSGRRIAWNKQVTTTGTF